MTRVTLLSQPWRLVAALLVVVALVTLPTYLAALVLLPPVPPIVMIRSFLVGTALPAVMAWTILRTFGGTAEVRDGMLRLRRGDLEIDVPCAAIAAVRPWWVPLPLPGLTLRLASRSPLPVGVGLARPDRLLDALEASGIDVAAARRHATVVWAATRPARRWVAPILKFGAFGTLPAGVLFYTHQHIAYGGPLGQYYLEGPAAYLATFGAYWATIVILLVSYAGLWRAAGELVVWMAGALRAEWATGARRAVEIGCGLAYYLGVPLLLALRYRA